MLKVNAGAQAAGCFPGVANTDPVTQVLSTFNAAEPGHDHPVTAVAANPDASTVYLTTPTDLYALDSSTGQVRCQLITG